MTEARILVGDCRTHMAAMDEESVDAIVCDPPYGLEFMGSDWDRSVPGVDYWIPALRVLKPGGYLLAFGGTRVFHRLGCAIEDGGFEIRDCLSWLYGSGFPKSLNLDGEMAGWGTALKPAWEPIIVARKPLIGTVVANVSTHGTGALNIDGCRVETDDVLSFGSRQLGDGIEYGICKPTTEGVQNSLGRWPANVVLDEDAAVVLDAQSGTLSSGLIKKEHRSGGQSRIGTFNIRDRSGEDPVTYGDTGGASRFFYVAKADRSERNKGLEGMAERTPHPDEPNGRAWDIPGSHSTVRANHHPTVKPVSLMQWLVRLVTPKGGTVLDPFMGSGTTGIAADREGAAFIGIEISGEYAEIARRRLVGAAPMFAKVSVA